ncbi:hypothetical protein LTR10_013978 [Elasticomyces elasticus]|nr:hypothetical protein LTR10_013978 [Elasticomyces elasticus]KAK4974441.1 hypothetical protein LTR42_005085 [Elasticomyces elasticus]
MRQSIDRHPERLKAILMDAEMRKSFLGNAPNNNSKAVKAFVESNAGNALKTKPKITFINSVIMPDDADSDDSGSASGTSNEHDDVE